MKLKDLTQEEIETMSFDQIAALVLEDKGKKMKLLDLFKEVCTVMNLPEETVEERIADFFELMSINKKFILLKNGFWDLSVNHKQEIVIEDEDDLIDEEELEDDEEIIEDSLEDEDIFYDNELDDDDTDDDDIKDLVIIDEDENIEE